MIMSYDIDYVKHFKQQLFCNVNNYFKCETDKKKCYLQALENYIETIIENIIYFYTLNCSYGKYI